MVACGPSPWHSLCLLMSWLKIAPPRHQLLVYSHATYDTKVPEASKMILCAQCIRRL